MYVCTLVFLVLRTKYISTGQLLSLPADYKVVQPSLPKNKNKLKKKKRNTITEKEKKRSFLSNASVLYRLGRFDQNQVYISNMDLPFYLSLLFFFTFSLSAQTKKRLGLRDLFRLCFRGSYKILHKLRGPSSVVGCGTEDLL